ncbi:hypothetical protein BZL29_4464 [Mycobacterium kansasii]|uniref:Uncharacterized protein n=1 Tax=Mycobacterium kansasii TaxID=1768 RepID=A0A1V3X6Q2_MYCKA|nr:hypothetical protein BZL29_4464 [Mycobacterium kansasii]
MSPDPATNLMWLDLIGRRLAEIGDKQRLPLIVRIDDPWLAEAWRAQQFGGSDTRWAADVVGRYEVTAGRLLDGIIATPNIQRVFICGTSQLTLALCADLTRRALERDFYTRPGCHLSRRSRWWNETPRTTSKTTSSTASRPASCRTDRQSTRCPRRRRYRPCCVSSVTPTRQRAQ